jgi:hypothetical protein
MKKFLTVVALVGLVASSASAIEVSLTPNWEDTGSKLDLVLSQTGVVSVYLNIGADDGNVSFMNAFFDASPLNDGATAGYDVVGREFKMQRNDGSGWFRAIPWDGDRNIEKYVLIAADDEPGNPGPGTNGPWTGHMDSIIIHGTEIGDYDLYFENRFTVDPGHAARPPQLFDLQSNQKLYANNLDLPGFMHFRNAWRDDAVGFDVPFVINVTPEPASLALLAIGGVALLRRRK